MENTSKQMANLTATVARVVVDVDRHGKNIKDVQSEIVKLKEENRLLKTAVEECKRYSWRWSLKLHGLKENVNEDVRKEVIIVLGKVAPGLQVYLEDGVDIAHRLGPKRTDGSNRPVIILFALRRILDAVWKCAKGCKFLRDNKLRLTQALSPEDRLAREKLWPLVDKARKEGKRATLIGPFALIDGKKINHWDVKRSETNKAELQEAPATSPRVILVKPASPENIFELQEVDDVQKESHKVLMSREKAHRTFNMTQQKNRRSKSNKAEVQEAPVSSHRVIMVKPASPENTILLQEGDHGKSVTSVELHSAERTTQRDPIQDQQQSDREPAPIQTPTSTRCDAVDEQLKDRPKSKLWMKRTAKVQPLNDTTLPPTEDDFVPKKKRKNIFRRAFSWLKRCSCFT
uniref:Uncharacterized protein n=2 Tax=Knipowitschia caucasica TaxID=637954 RepID=A0AAV2L2R3_KNICA